MTADGLVCTDPFLRGASGNNGRRARIPSASPLASNRPAMIAGQCLPQTDVIEINNIHPTTLHNVVQVFVERNGIIWAVYFCA